MKIAVLMCGLVFDCQKKIIRELRNAPRRTTAMFSYSPAWGRFLLRTNIVMESSPFLLYLTFRF